MCEEYWKYVGIHFVEDDENVIFWMWRGPVLGLYDAAHILTCLLAPLVAAGRA